MFQIFTPRFFTVCKGGKTPLIGKMVLLTFVFGKLSVKK
jgi:hypothetical protein